MATVIIGGLIFASILTLILTPSILMIEARIGAWFAARRAPADAPVGAAVGAASAATATNLGRNGRA
jgi:hypothetical protein